MALTFRPFSSLERCQAKWSLLRGKKIRKYTALESKALEIFSDPIGTEKALAKLVLRLISAPLFAGLLAGCVESTSAVSLEPEVNHRLVRRDDTNPSVVSLGLMSLTGAPEMIEARFRTAFEAEAGQREISFTLDKTDYLLRGYLSAYPAETGTAIAVVWDIFDARKKRAQRLEDRTMVKLSPEDPWAALTDEDIRKIASLSAESLVAFLSNTPEAENAAKTAVARDRPSAPDADKVASLKLQNSAALHASRAIAVKGQRKAIASNENREATASNKNMAALP
jgi:hypothetical protein